jgi:Ni,Fe-hydrogenase I cytochrome b subunit
MKSFQLEKLEKRKIYDPLLRLCHIGIALTCLTLIASAYSAEFFYEDGALRKVFWLIHIYSGFTLIPFLMVRLLWGIIGPEYARWGNLWKWNEWLLALKQRRTEFEWGWGHHPLASLGYFGFYLVLVIMSLTGLVLSAIEHDLGPLASRFYDELYFKKDLLEFHEALSLLIILFIFSHLYALLWHQRNEKFPVIQSMFSGNQYRIKRK